MLKIILSVAIFYNSGQISTYNVPTTGYDDCFHKGVTLLQQAGEAPEIHTVILSCDPETK